MKCPMCYTEVKRGKVTEEYLGHELGEFEGWICSKCGETLLTEQSAKVAFNKAKKLGLTGLSERGTIAKSGNSLVVRIKKTLADYLNITAGKQVFLHPEGKNKLVVEIA
ncbi:MAG: YgiT-type zinc finger protein [Candidatus Micrarchaeota archaeon]